MDNYKIMVTGNDEGIVWDVLMEKESEYSSIILQHLLQHIDVAEWKCQYLNLYKSWLIDDNESIYDISSSINMKMINAVTDVNKSLFDFKLYYWFDVDRDKYPNYVWEKCPLSGLDLFRLPDKFHKNNRKLSPGFPLMFPDT